MPKGHTRGRPRKHETRGGHGDSLIDWQEPERNAHILDWHVRAQGFGIVPVEATTECTAAKGSYPARYGTFRVRPGLRANAEPGANVPRLLVESPRRPSRWVEG